MKRDQFTFYRSYYEALKHLSKRDQTAVLMAVIGYALDETVPSLTGVPLSVFTLIRPTLDSGRNRARNRMNKMKSKQEQNNNKKEQSGNEGEGEVESEKECEREVECEVEGECECENDSYYPLPPTDPAVAAVMNAYMNRIDPTPSPSSMDELKGYIKLMGPECCIRAIDAALNAKAATWNYIRRVLQSKASQGVRCIADWDALEARREERKRGDVQNAGAATGGTFRGWRAKSALDDAD